MGKQWIAIFSQTGSELDRLVKYTGMPDMVINHSGRDSTYHEFNQYKMNTEEVFYFIRNLDPDEYYITLHGFLRIIPPDICDRFEIYNGHPALIQFYPELKGKDPQIRSVNYDWIGSVVHKVTAEVDGGEILHSVMAKNVEKTEDFVYNTLKNTSFACWIEFFHMKGKLKVRFDIG